MGDRWWGLAAGAPDGGEAELVYPVITLSGSSREMGRQHGVQLSERIRRSLSTLRLALGAATIDAGWDAFQPSVEYCRAEVPELIAEMEGIADGAGLPFCDIWAINAHLDLSVWKRTAQELGEEPGELPGCSSHAVATPQGSALMGWNGDDLSDWMDSGVVVRAAPDDGRPPFAYFSWAGTVGRPGTSLAIAVGANSMPPAAGHRPDGLLYGMVCRKLLECTSTGAALKAMACMQTCSAMNYCLGDASGELADVETDSREVRVLLPETGQRYLLHTNHYIHTEHDAKNDLWSERRGGALSPCPRLQVCHATLVAHAACTL